MRRVVRGFWGPRPESADALAGRWQRTLEGLAALVPQAADAWSQVHGNGPATAFTPEGDALLDAVRTAQSAADWSDLTGTGLRLVGTGTLGWEAEVSGLVGGRPEFLLQSLAVILH
ncbi:hypothetical protein GT040_15930, partial [Streptomyces sp. SID2119]|nr:hypothetical protein [Streptomyces sp. SID2119]